MDVSSAGSVGGPGPIRPASASPIDNSGAAPRGLEVPQDEVEISSAARMLNALQNDPQMHADRLAEIRAAIDDGTYETEAKLEAAVERLLNELRRTDR